MKKVIGLSLLGIIIVGGLVVAFLPVMIYGGFNVSTVEGTLAFQGTTYVMPHGGVKQLPAGDISFWTLDLENQTQSSYEYFWDKRNVPEEEDDGSVFSLKLTLTLTITDELNDTVQEIYYGAFLGDQEHNITVTFGPGEGITESGYYNIYLHFALVVKILLEEYFLDFIMGPITIYVHMA
jgi:hypothetical protein